MRKGQVFGVMEEMHSRRRYMGEQGKPKEYCHKLHLAISP